MKIQNIIFTDWIFVLKRVDIRDGEICEDTNGTHPQTSGHNDCQKRLFAVLTSTVYQPGIFLLLNNFEGRSCIIFTTQRTFLHKLQANFGKTFILLTRLLAHSGENIPDEEKKVKCRRYLPCPPQRHLSRARNTLCNPNKEHIDNKRRSSIAQKWQGHPSHR